MAHKPVAIARHPFHAPTMRLRPLAVVRGNPRPVSPGVRIVYNQGLAGEVPPVVRMPPAHIINNPDALDAWFYGLSPAERGQVVVKVERLLASLPPAGKRLAASITKQQSRLVRGRTSLDRPLPAPAVRGLPGEVIRELHGLGWVGPVLSGAMQAGSAVYTHRESTRSNAKLQRQAMAQQAKLHQMKLDQETKMQQQIFDLQAKIALEQHDLAMRQAAERGTSPDAPATGGIDGKTLAIGAGAIGAAVLAATMM